MPYGITDAGFNRKRLIDIQEEIETALKAVFGDNIDLDPDTGFGQFVTIMSEALADQWESQEDVYNSQYPSTSSNVSLSNVVMYNGLLRDDPEYSTITTVTLTGAVGTSIPAGSQASVVSTGVVFETDAVAVIGGGGTVVVSMTAIEYGPFSAAIGTLSVIETPIYGWTGVNNTVAAVEGNYVETDAELKERRTESVSIQGQNFADAVYSQLLALDTVIAVLVIDNKTDAVDVYGVPAHEFECIVQGGVPAEIAAVIWSNTPVGIMSHGDEEETIVDAQGNDQSVWYSEPEDIPIYFRVDITVDGDFPGTGSADIKDSIVEYGEAAFSIGDDVIYSQFFAPIHETPGILTVDLYMDDITPPVAQGNVTIDLTQLGTYSTTNVTVNIL